MSFVVSPHLSHCPSLRWLLPRTSWSLGNSSDTELGSLFEASYHVVDGLNRVVFPLPHPPKYVVRDDPT